MVAFTVIYHNPCTDGFASAWAAHRALGGRMVDERQPLKTDETIYIGAQYGSSPPWWAIQGRHVLMLDVSWKRDMMFEICRHALSVSVIDHHISAENELATGEHIGTLPSTFRKRAHELVGVENISDLPPQLKFSVLVDVENAASVLTWKWFGGLDSAPPALLAYVEDRDLFKFDLPDSREIAAYLHSVPLDFNGWDAMAPSLGMRETFVSAVSQGAAILRYQRKMREQYLPQALQFAEIAGYAVPCVNAPGFMASDTGHVLSRGHVFAATYYDLSDGQRCWSLRSQPSGIDVARIAERYNGGGHKHASGFHAPRDAIRLIPGDQPPPLDAVGLAAVVDLRGERNNG